MTWISFTLRHAIILWLLFTRYYILSKSVCFKYFDTMSAWDQDIGHIVNNKADCHGDIGQIWHFMEVSLRIEARTRIQRNDDEHCGSMKCGVTHPSMYYNGKASTNWSLKCIYGERRVPCSTRHTSIDKIKLIYY